MTEKKPIDVKNTGIAFSQLIRDQHNARRVNWVPSTSLDPAVRAQDRAALNAALRRAAGHTPPDEADEPEPQTFPWKSLGSDDDGQT